jgi:hypothetical protein
MKRGPRRERLPPIRKPAPEDPADGLRRFIARHWTAPKATPKPLKEVA